MLSRFRINIPASARRAKNSYSDEAPAAAVLTARCSVIRGASRRPHRLAFWLSARVGRRAAVRSPGAVRRSPYRCSAIRQVSRTRYRSFESRGLPPSCRANIATMWMWSAPCRTATHRTASSSWPLGARPVRCTTSRAICAHSASASVLSSGAARTAQCHTGRSKPRGPRAACGCCSNPLSRRKHGVHRGGAAAPAQPEFAILRSEWLGCGRVAQHRAQYGLGVPGYPPGNAGPGRDGVLPPGVVFRGERASSLAPKDGRMNRRIRYSRFSTVLSPTSCKVIHRSIHVLTVIFPALGSVQRPSRILAS